MDRIVKVCQIVAIAYYLLLITGNECQTTDSQSNGSTVDVNQIIAEIFDIPEATTAETGDRHGSGDTYPQPQPTPSTYPITQPNVVQPETHYPPPTAPPPVHHEHEYKPPPPPQQPSSQYPPPQQPSSQYPPPTGHPTGPYPKPSEVPAYDNEPNVSETNLFGWRSRSSN